MGEKHLRSEAGARAGEAGARRKGRDRLALLILVILAVQSIARLVLMVTYNPERATLAVYHLATLAALAAAAALLLVRVPPTRWGRALVAAILAVMTFLLWSYDVLALASARFGDTFFSFRFVADNWCASSIDATCVARFPLVFLGAGGFILVSAAVYFLVHGELRARASALLPKAEHLPLVRRLGTQKLLAAGLIGFAAWNALAAGSWRDEPLHSLFLSRFELGPSELLVGKLPAYRGQPTPGVRPRPLVIIVVDSMRADKIGLAPGKPTATPFLRSLALSGRLHDVAPAYSVCTSSYCGILGTVMAGSWADMQSRKGPTISQALQAEGYRGHFVVSGKHDRFANIRDFYGSELAHYSDEYELDDRSVVARLDQLAFADPAKSFVFMHLMSAHLAGRRFFPEKAPQIDSRLPWEVLQEQVGIPALARYYEQGMQQADEVIRRIFDVLDRKGLLADALVVITADHGERIGERNMIGHLGTPDPAVSQIPLLIYDAHRTYPRRPIASQIDAAPTLLQAIGANIPRQWSGEPLQRESARRAVAVDSRTVTGAAFRYRNEVWFYTCDRINGEETVWRAGVKLENSPMRPAAIAAGRRALRTLPPRNDVELCRR
jgi:hypothetical protein